MCTLLRIVGIAGVLLAAGCSQAPPNEVLPCPTLFSGGGSYVGFLGMPGELEPAQCVEFYVDGEQRAFVKTSFDGSFFTAFPLDAQQYGKAVEMRIGGSRYTVPTGGPTQAQIAYDPDMVPLRETDEGGRAHVRVRMEGSIPLRAYAVNQSMGATEFYDPPYA